MKKIAKFFNWDRKPSQITEMEPFEMAYFDNGSQVLRVPGGWIFTICLGDHVNSVFVPFSLEFSISTPLSYEEVKSIIKSFNVADPVSSQAGPPEPSKDDPGPV